MLDDDRPAVEEQKQPAVEGGGAHPAPLGRLRDAAAVLGVLALFAVVAVALSRPFLQDEPGSGLPISRYIAMEDGRGTLLTRTAADGSVQWESQVVELLPGLRALQLPDLFDDALAELLGGEGTSASDLLDRRELIDRARVAQVSIRTRRDDGSSASDGSVQVLTEDGLFLLGFAGGPGDPDTIIDPAIPLLPPDPVEGTERHSTGRFGSLSYTWDTEVVSRGAEEFDGRTLEDCIVVESALGLVVESTGATQDVEYRDRFCAGRGLIDSISSGDIEEDVRVVSDFDEPLAGELPPGAAEAGAEGAPAFAPHERAPEDWVLGRLGSAVPLNAAGQSTFAPVYVPGQSPVVLAATEGRNALVALDAGDVAGTVAWQVPAGGPIYGQPRYDAGNERIYFGSSDGRLRAVGIDGLFLWSFATADNVTTRPVAAGDVVVFGSEDGTVYGLDAARGEQRWSLDAGGPVVASPAVAGDVVAIGSDSGTVVGIDPAAGERRWTYSAAGAVEAGIGVAGGGFLVADRTGALALLDPEDGSERWVVDASNEVAIRFEPVATDSVVVVVDEIGRMSGLDLDTGERRWQRSADYTGVPVVVGDVFVAVQEGGAVDAVNEDGELVARGDAANAVAGTDLPPTFDHGPGVGGGTIWLADEYGVVRRWGDDTGAAPLRPVWFKQIIEAPFQGYLAGRTPVPWRDSALIVDGPAFLYEVDPLTGEGAAVGQLATGDGDVLFNDVIVAGDVLIADLSVRVAAFDLPAGTERWSVPISGAIRQGLALAADTVVVSAGTEQSTAVMAIGLERGDVRWQAASGGTTFPVGLVVEDGVVYGGSPLTAYDLDDGEARWTSDVTGGAGGPAVDPDAGVVSVTTARVDAGGEHVEVVALDTATGAVLWRAPTPDPLAAVGSLIAADGLVIVPTVSSALTALDGADGTLVWERRMPAPVLGLPALIDGKIWLALTGAQVLTIDPGSGAILGRFEGIGTDIGAQNLIQRPAQIGGVVVVAAGSIVFAVAEAPS